MWSFARLFRYHDCRCKAVARSTRPRFGYQRIWVLLWREGCRINPKQVRRFYRLVWVTALHASASTNTSLGMGAGPGCRAWGLSAVSGTNSTSFTPRASPSKMPSLSRLIAAPQRVFERASEFVLLTEAQALIDAWRFGFNRAARTTHSGI